jgi:four helix bundle protein
VARIERFEDLIAWQKARVLVRAILAATRTGEFTRHRSLSDQIQRASVSVMSNIAEGFERGGRAEFAHFLSIAKASCAETRSLLYVCLDAGLLSQRAFDDLLDLALETGRVVGGLRAAVARQRETESRAKLSA